MKAPVVLAAIASFGIAGAVALGPSAARAEAGGAVADTATTAAVRVVTYNIRHGLDDRVAVEDAVHLAGRGVDILALQEMSGGKRRQALRDQLVDCSLCPFDAHMAAVSPPGNLPILYRWDRFRLVDAGDVLVSEETYVGPAGAGPARLPAKHITYAGLRERTTGRVLYVLNNHAVSSVQGRGGSRNERYPERLRLYRKHMVALQELVTRFEATGAAVLVVGDLNVNYRRDKVVQDRLFPYARLGAVGVKSSFQRLGEPARGTHTLGNGNDSRLIDYVASTSRAGVEMVDQRVLRRYNSDHRPLLVDFTLRAE